MIDSFLGRSPRFDDSNYIAPTAAVVGDVTLGTEASIWFGASLRGDVHWIEIGARSNVQDCAVVHVSRETHPCKIGRGVTIGHTAIVHGCTVEDDCLIGMGAVVLDGAVIREGSIVGANALVTMNTVVPPRSLMLGSPAKVVRQLTEEEVAHNKANATHYVRMSKMYLRLDRPTTNPFYVDERGH